MVPRGDGLNYYNLEDMFYDINQSIINVEKKNVPNYELIGDMILYLYEKYDSKGYNIKCDFKFIESFLKTLINEIASANIDVEVSVVQNYDFLNKSNAVMAYNLNEGIKISSKFVNSDRLANNPILLVNALCHEVGHIEQLLTTKKFINAIINESSSNLNNYDKTVARVVIANSLVNVGQNIDLYLERYDADLREYDANIVRNQLFDTICEKTFTKIQNNARIKSDMIKTMYSNHFQNFDADKIDRFTKVLLKKAQQNINDNYGIFNNAISECQICPNQIQLGDRVN